MTNVFTKIINREIPGYIVAETPDCIAFLDIHPLAVGHTLVVPKQKVDDVFDLDDAVLAEVMAFARKVALGIKKTIPCLRVGIAVVGLEVPHAHIHLIPLHDIDDDISFRKPKLKQSQAELHRVAKQLRANIAH